VRLQKSESLLEVRDHLRAAADRARGDAAPRIEFGKRNIVEALRRWRIGFLGTLR